VTLSFSSWALILVVSQSVSYLVGWATEPIWI